MVASTSVGGRLGRRRNNREYCATSFLTRGTTGASVRRGPVPGGTWFLAEIERNSLG